MARSVKINIKDRITDGEIDLSMSDLQDVPVKDIAIYKKAFSLDLSNNHLKTLPVNFATLTHLSKLDLSNNQLSELPDNFGDLIKLKYLDLYQNKLQYLPLSFSKLKALKWLDLKDNPLVPAVAKVSGPCLDAKQCQACARDVVNFFTQVQEQVDNKLEQQRQQQKQQEIKQQATMEKKSAAKKTNKEQKPKPQKISSSGAKETAQKSNNKKNKKGNSSDKKSDKCSSCSWFKCLFVLIILGLVALFVITSIKCECTRSLEAAVVSWYMQGTNKLPPNLQPYGIQAGAWVKQAHEKTGNVTLQVVEYVKNTENFVNAYNALGDCIQNLLKKIKEQYKQYVS